MTPREFAVETWGETWVENEWGDLSTLMGLALADQIDVHEALQAQLARLTEQIRAARLGTPRRGVVLDLLSDPETAGLTDRALAKRAGVSPQTVNTWRHRMRQAASTPSDGEGT